MSLKVAVTSGRIQERHMDTSHKSYPNGLLRDLRQISESRSPGECPVVLNESLSVFFLRRLRTFPEVRLTSHLCKRSVF